MRMLRPSILLNVLLAVGICSLEMLPRISIALAQTSSIGPVAPGGPNLKQTLEKGLKARRPSEFAFIAMVVRKVSEGSLPVQVVERTFLWARDNKQPWPMPYFEMALRIQAKKFRVNLPFTDT